MWGRDRVLSIPANSPIPSTAGARRFLVLDDAQLLAQCDETHQRGSGPGGQKRNKTSSAVRLVHRPTGVTVLASDNRSQRINKAHALRRLREALALGIRGPIISTAHAPGEELRALVAQSAISSRTATSERYYIAIAEVLDVIAEQGGAVAESAAVMGISTSALNRVLQANDHVWQGVNELRRAVGRTPLRR